MGWEVRTIQQLNLKDRNAAIADIQEWLEYPDSRSQMKTTQYKYLLDGFLAFFKQEWKSNNDKLRNGIKATATYLNQLTLILKGIIVRAAEVKPRSINDNCLIFLQTIACSKNDYSHVYIHILRTLTSIVSVLKNSISSDKWQELISFSMDFVNNSLDLGSRPHTPEIFESIKLFGILLSTANRDKIIRMHSEQILLFIGDYLAACEDIEVPGFQILIPCAWRTIITLGMEHVDISYRFLCLIFPRVRILLNARNENLRITVNCLLLLYIQLGSAINNEIEAEVPFMHNLLLLSSYLLDIVSINPPELSIDLLPLIYTQKIYEISSTSTLARYYAIFLLSEISRVELNCIDVDKLTHYDSQSVRPKKRPKFDTENSSSINALFDNPNLNFLALNVLSIMLTRHPDLAHKVSNIYGSLLEQMALSNDPKLSEYARFCCSLLYKNKQKINIDKSVVNINVSSSIGTVLMCEQIALNNYCSRKLIFEMVEKFLELSIIEHPTYYFDCLIQLFDLLDIWDIDHVSRLVAKLFSCFEDNKNNSKIFDHLNCIANLLIRLGVKCNSFKVKELKNLISDEALMFQQYLDFEFNLNCCFQNNLELANLLVPTIVKPNESSNRHYQFFIPFVDAFYNIVMHWVNSKEISSYSFNVSITLLKIVRFNEIIQDQIQAHPNWLDFQKFCLNHCHLKSANCNFEFLRSILEFQCESVLIENYELTNLVKNIDFKLERSRDASKVLVLQETKYSTQLDFKCYYNQLNNLTVLLTCLSTKESNAAVLYEQFVNGLAYRDSYELMVAAELFWDSFLFHLNIEQVEQTMNSFLKRLKGDPNIKIPLITTSTKFLNAVLDQPNLYNGNIRIQFEDILKIFLMFVVNADEQIQLLICSLFARVIGSEIKVFDISEYRKKCLYALWEGNFEVKTRFCINVLPLILKTVPEPDRMSLLENFSQIDGGLSIPEIISHAMIQGNLMIQFQTFQQPFLNLCSLVYNRKELRIISKIVEKVAEYFEFPSKFEFISSCLTFVCSRFGMPMNQFPFEICGFKTLKDFIDNFFNPILQGIILSQDDQKYEELKSITSSFEDLKAQHFTNIYSKMFLMGVDQSYLERFIQKPLDPRLLFQSVIKEMLLYLRGLDPYDESLDTSLASTLIEMELPTSIYQTNESMRNTVCISRIIKRYGGLAKWREILKPKQIFELFVYLHKGINSQGKTNHAVEIFQNGYIIGIALAGDNLFEPFLYQYCTKFLINKLESGFFSKVLPLLNYIIIGAKKEVNLKHELVLSLLSNFNEAVSQNVLLEVQPLISALLAKLDDINLGLLSLYPQNLKSNDIKYERNWISLENLTKWFELMGWEYWATGLYHLNSFLDLNIASTVDTRSIRHRILKNADIQKYGSSKLRSLHSKVAIKLSCLNQSTDACIVDEFNLHIEIVKYLNHPQTIVVEAAIESFNSLLHACSSGLELDFPLWRTSLKEFFPLSKVNMDYTKCKGGQTNSNWIISHVSELLMKLPSNCIYRHCFELASKSPSFAEKLLTAVLKVGIFDTAGSNSFFNESIVTLFRHPADHISQIRTYLNAFETMIKHDPLKTIPLLPVDISCLVNSAIQSGEYYFALYLNEISHANGTHNEKEFWTGMLECLRGIEEADGFAGVLASLDTTHVDVYQISQAKRVHDRNWVGLWSSEDSILQSNRDSSLTGLIEGLSNSGHYYTLGRILNGGSTCLETIDKERYFESLWRLGQWGSVTESSIDGPRPLQAQIFNGLRKMEVSLVLENLVIEDLAVKPISLSLLEIEEGLRVNIGEFSPELFVQTWSNRTELLVEKLDFFECERILSVRIQILKSMLSRSATSNLKGYEKLIIAEISQLLNHLLDISLNENALVHARKACLELRKSYKNLSESSNIELNFRLLEIEWLGGERDIALTFLSELIQNAKKAKDYLLQAQLTHKYACWCIESKKFSANQILSNYLEPASLYVSSNSCEFAGTVYFDFALYCDELLSNMESDEIHKRSKIHLKQRERDLEDLKSISSRGSSKSAIHIKKLSRQVDLDRQSIKEFENQKLNYALKCCENYLKSLISSNERNEHAIFRFVSLWFANYLNYDFNATVQKFIGKIATKKFFDVLYQLTARLFAHDPNDSIFYSLLSNLILEITCDYPYLSCQYILAAKNVSKEKRGISSLSQETISLFLKQLKSRKDVHRIAYHLDSLFTAYISIANLDVSQFSQRDMKKNFSIDSSQKLLKLGISQKIPVITARQRYLKPGQHDDLIFISEFKNTYTIPGGINAPKVLDCIGSDGNIYKQLVKGKDDLRQDAVISSVFEIMNKFLYKTKTAKYRNLKIRTYIVVPLASQAGVVEWVNGTVPFGEILASGYARAPPKWTLAVCRQKMKKEHERPGSNIASKLKVFSAIEENVPPVLGDVFFTQYTDSRLWYQNRLRYMRSAAVSSMAGYILGIGDRHSSNLLFDEESAEIIHIDLGIAFDQGRLLTTPELVPFRLTRNMIHAMGSTGYRGVFQSACEIAMKIFKQESSILMTLLEVFKYDPLHSWSISPLKLHRIQRDESIENEMFNDGYQKPETLNVTKDEADHALFGIQRKLNSSLTVECQIQELINEAIDKENLCRMYPGWQPWI